MKKVYTIDEAEELIDEIEPKHIALYNDEHKKIITFNSYVANSIDKKKIEIFRHLNSKHTPDGIYILKTQSRLSGKMATNDYYIAKGENLIVSPEQLAESPTTQTMHIIEKQNSNNSGLSVNEVIELRTENATLKLENDSYKRDIERLEEEIQEMEESEPLSENNTTSFLQSLAEQVIPIVDKHLTQKDKKLEIEEARLTYDIKKHLENQPPPQQIAPPTPPPQEPQYVDIEKLFPTDGLDPESEEYAIVEKLRYLYVNDPQAYTEYTNELESQEYE